MKNLFFLLIPICGMGQVQWNQIGDNSTTGRLLISGYTSSNDYDDITISRNKTDAGIKIFNSGQTGRAVVFFGEAYGGRYGYLAHHGRTHDPGSGFTQIFQPSSTSLVGSDVNGLSIVSYGDMRLTSGGSFNSNQRMVIKANGNVGIGTLEPRRQGNNTCRRGESGFKRPRFPIMSLKETMN